MDYSKYKIEDFVLDPAFRTWVLQPSASANVFWERWITEHPDKVTDIKDAREILLSMSRVNYQPTEEMEDEVWSKIDLDTSDLSPEERDVVPLNASSIIERYPNQKSSRGFVKWVYSGVAASILLVVALLGYLKIYDANQHENQVLVEVFRKENTKGQKSNILLSDGTRVLLNAESSIEYTSAYNEEERRVILSGEAFFEVAKDPGRPFIVETKSLNTTALGTSFNVNAYYGEKTEVVLFTGKVKVEAPRDTAGSVILLPGEKVKLTGSNNLIKSDADLTSEALWKDGIIYFHDTPMMQALNELERWYGVEVKVENPGHQVMMITGRFDNENLMNVLRSLSYSSGFDFDIEDKNVTIKF